MWDLPGRGLEPVSPALAGGFVTTAPPGFLMRGFHHREWMIILDDHTIKALDLSAFPGSLVQ